MHECHVMNNSLMLHIVRDVVIACNASSLRLSTFLDYTYAGAETTLAAPLDRWIVNSGKTFVPRATRRPEVAEAAMHQ